MSREKDRDVMTSESYLDGSKINFDLVNTSYRENDLAPLINGILSYRTLIGNCKERSNSL
jgi:hypothetical protein